MPDWCASGIAGAVVALLGAILVLATRDFGLGLAGLDRQADRSIELSRRTQASERFSAAIDQLGARAGSRRAVEVRLGAIVALQNYPEQAGPDDSREREEALGTVMTVLAAYVRTNSPLRRDRASAPGGGSQPPPLLPGCLGRAPIRPSPRFSPDVSAAIAGFVDTTRKYRTASLGYGLTTVDLSHTDLRGADFSGADVKRATFEGSDLARAAFHYADLDEAVLDGVDARNVCFYAAQLDRASLEGALLDGAAVCASFLDRLPRGRRVQRMSRIAGC